MSLFKFLIFSLILHSLLFIKLSGTSPARETLATPLHLEPQVLTSEKNLNKETNTKPTKSHTPSSATNYPDQLINFIQAKAKYPKSALALKQEGVVVMNLTIDMAGAITDFKVLKPAKFSALTSAAVNLLKGITKFKPLPKELHPLKTFTVPIYYVLY